MAALDRVGVPAIPTVYVFAYDASQCWVISQRTASSSLTLHVFSTQPSSENEAALADTLHAMNHSHAHAAQFSSSENIDHLATVQ